jgi:hypothetical protein
LVKGSVYDDAPESLMDYFARFERLMTRASRLHGAPAACGAAEAPRDGPAGAGAAAGALSRP